VKRVAWKRLAGGLVVLAAAGYLAYSIADNWQQMRLYDWRVRPGWLVASIAAHVGVLSAGVWGWSLTLRWFDTGRAPLSQLLRLWFLSNLARYVPGKIFQFVALAHLGRAAGHAPALLLTSILVHTGMALVSACLIAAWTLGGIVVPQIDRWALSLVVTAAALGVVHPVAINGAIGVVPRLLGREAIRWAGNWAAGIFLLALSFANWAAYGAAYHLFVAALAEVPWHLLPQLAGVNALSFVIGYVSLLPGGIGLREVAMTELLRPFLPGGVGAVLAVAARLWTIVAELTGAVVALGLTRWAASARRRSPQAE
jgi:glycosyltransferase 2 family protein